MGKFDADFISFYITINTRDYSGRPPCACDDPGDDEGGYGCRQRLTTHMQGCPRPGQWGEEAGGAGTAA
jgi:hypothetical protein